MSYKEDDYDKLIERADRFMRKDKYDEAWECIAAIPDEVKFTEFTDDCAFFASIALNARQFDAFIRYFKAYFNTITKPDNAFSEDLNDLFDTMICNFHSYVHPHIVQVIDIVLARFRTPNVLTVCANISNQMCSHEKALMLLDEALDKDPFYANAWHEKVFAYHYIGDVEKELECCNYYLALVPDTKEYTILIPIANSFYAAQRYDDSVATLKTLLGNKDLSPEHVATVHCLLAESYCALSDARNELIHRQKAIDSYPNEAGYWSMLAQYYITTEDKPLKAEKIMTEAMEKFPSDPVILYMTAAVECQIAVKFNKHSHLDMAAEHIEHALIFARNDFLFLLLAARIHLLKKDYPLALKHARHAYLINPNDNNAILYKVLASFGCGKLTEFRKMYRIYAKINPSAREDITIIIPEAAAVIDRMK